MGSLLRPSSRQLRRRSRTTLQPGPRLGHEWSLGLHVLDGLPSGAGAQHLQVVCQPYGNDGATIELGRKRASDQSPESPTHQCLLERIDVHLHFGQRASSSSFVLPVACFRVSNHHGIVYILVKNVSSKALYTVSENGCCTLSDCHPPCHVSRLTFHPLRCRQPGFSHMMVHVMSTASLIVAPSCP